MATVTNITTFSITAGSGAFGTNVVGAPMEITGTYDRSTFIGTFQGYAGSYGAFDYLVEDKNQSIQTSDNPNQNQGTAKVSWNFFPVVAEDHPAPASEETSELETSPQRDSSRYKKVYSFTRQQPVRIRVFNR